MPRLMLSDEHWSKLKVILLHNAVYNKRDLRMTVEDMLYRMRTGCPWRDLPKVFGKWLRIFKKLVVDPDMEWTFIDGSFAKAHQHSAGAANGTDEAIGKSRGGNTSKIHMVVDAHGLPVEFEITGDQINDCTQAASLIAKLSAAGVVVADKGYDSEAIRAQIVRQGAQAIIPRKRNSVKGNADMDWGFIVTDTWLRISSLA